MKQTTNKIEFNKIPGFDVLEKLPEEQMLRSYNEDFYTSLNSVKILNNPLLSDHKLLYHFEQNDNASVSTTTGQLLVIIIINKIKLEHL